MTSSKATYGIITTNRELIIENWNEWLESVTGISASIAIGRKITEIIPDIESRGLGSRLNKALNEGTVEILSSVFHKYLIKCERKIPGNDAVVMKQHVTIGPLKSEHGVVGLIISVEDASGFRHFIEADEPLDDNVQNLSNIDWRIRKDAQLKLSKGTNNATLAWLFKIMKEQHHDVGILNSILLVLSQSESDIVGALLSLLEEDDPDLRLYVIQTLGDRNDPQAIPTLMQCLNDSDANIQYHAIEALGKLEAHEATDHLVSIALSGNFFISFPAIDALSMIGDSSVVIKVLPLIDDPFFCDAVAGLLGKLGDADVVEFLCEKFNKSEFLATTVIRALLEINSRYEILFEEGGLIKDQFNKFINADGINNLIKAAENTETDDIQNIIKILGWVPSVRAQKSLTRMLGNPSLQKEVIEAFVNFGYKVTDLLIDQLHTSDNETRNAAAIALGRIGDPKSTEPLIQMIGENEELTVFVIGSLAKLGERAAFEPLLKTLGDPNPAIRRASIAALNSIGHPEMPARIEKLIQYDDPLFRESAIHIAGYFGFSNCKHLVQNCLEDSDIRVVCAAIENLPFFDDPTTNSILGNLYNQGSTRIRASVVKAATHIDDASKFKTLAESLNDSDAWVRYYSIRTICYHLLREHLPILMVMAEKDKAIHVRLAAIEAIGQLNGIQAIPLFSKLLHDEINDIVLTTIYALGMLESENSLILLMPLINDRDTYKRSAAIKAVSHFNVPEVIEKLHWIAATENLPMITNAAIEGLSTLNSVQSIDYLIQLSLIPKIKEKCITALIQQKNLALPHLVITFNERPAQIKKNIIEFLSRSKKPEASEALIQFLNHENAQVRLEAMNALYRIGNLTAMEKIYKISATDQDVFVRNSAREILKKS